MHVKDMLRKNYNKSGSYTPRAHFAIGCTQIDWWEWTHSDHLSRAFTRPRHELRSELVFKKCTGEIRDDLKNTPVIDAKKNTWSLAPEFQTLISIHINQTGPFTANHPHTHTFSKQLSSILNDYRGLKQASKRCITIQILNVIKY
jgi:hypothetical protein